MLYIARHGKTDWNVANRMQGRTDTHLNEIGRAQARELHGQAADIPFDICYVSTLSRARETAELLLEGRNVPIIPDERLVEIGFGSAEGITNASSHTELPVSVLFNDPARYVAAPDAESLEALFGRLQSFREELLSPALAQGKNVLLVSHGGTLCALLTLIRGTSMEHFWDQLLNNARLTEIPDAT